MIISVVTGKQRIEKKRKLQEIREHAFLTIMEGIRLLLLHVTGNFYIYLKQDKDKINTTG